MESDDIQIGKPIPVRRADETPEETEMRRSAGRPPGARNKPKPVDLDTLDRELAAIGYQPTPDMKKLKAELMAACVGKSTSEIRALSLSDIQGLGIISRKLTVLYQNPEFLKWFLNSGEMDVRVNYLLTRSLDNIEEIIDGDGELFSIKDKLAAQKQLLDIYETIKRVSNNSHDSTTKEIAAPRLDAKEFARKLYEAETSREKDKAAEKSKGKMRDVTIVFPLSEGDK